MAREPASRDGVLQESIFAQQGGCTDRPYADGTRYSIGCVTTNGNEIRHLVGLHPMALAHLYRTDARHLAEHRRRRGDPAIGGSTRRPIMTAYRQQALACAAAMAQTPARPRDLKHAMPDAPKILLRNVYGWFTRVERGLYALSDSGRAALVQWQTAAPSQSSRSARNVQPAV